MPEPLSRQEAAGEDAASTDEHDIPTTNEVEFDVLPGGATDEGDATRTDPLERHLAARAAARRGALVGRLARGPERSSRTACRSARAPCRRSRWPAPSVLVDAALRPDRQARQQECQHEQDDADGDDGQMVMGTRYPLGTGRKPPRLSRPWRSRSRSRCRCRWARSLRSRSSSRAPTSSSRASRGTAWPPRRSSAPAPPSATTPRPRAPTSTRRSPAPTRRSGRRCAR